MTANLPYPQDFRDWLPPILVKELRQGLRANAFGAVFVIMQVAVVVLMGLRLLSDGSEDITVQALDEYLWMAVGASLLLLLPLRGITSISDETSQHTLDLVQLTHMGSFKIVWGKWVAMVSLTVLFVTSLLPYQVLYYFFGGVDVVANLRLLGWMFFASLILTAFCLAISGTTMLVRLVALAIVGFPVFGLSADAIRRLVRGYSGSGLDLSIILSLLCYGIVAIPFLLAIAAARIGHSSENGSAAMRGIALTTVIAAPLGCWVVDGNNAPPWLLLSIPFIVWAGLESMTEQASPLPSLYLRPAKRGFLGRTLGTMFYRGWGPGLIFVAVATAGLFAAGIVLDNKSLARGYSSPSLRSESMLHLGMAIVFPAVVLCVVPRVRQRHWLYVIIQIACALWYIEIQSISFNSDATKAALMSVIPTSAMFWCMDYHANDYTAIIESRHATALIVDAIILLWLLYRSRSEFRIIREGEAQARRLWQASPEPSTAPASPDL